MQHRGDGLLRTVARALGIHYLPKTIHGTTYRLPIEALSPLFFFRRARFIDQYEGDYHKAVMDLVQPGHTIFDVGAFIGLYALAFSAVTGAEGRVVCFEPNPYNFAVLEKTLQANDIRNAMLVPQALGNSSGQTEFWVRGVSSTSSLRVYRVTGHHRLEKLMIDVTRLDDYIEHTGLVPHVLKIDVEGAEFEVLQGARQTLANHDVRVCCELHPIRLTAQGMTSETVFELLADSGYRVEREFKPAKWREELPFRVICRRI